MHLVSGSGSHSDVVPGVVDYLGVDFVNSLHVLLAQAPVKLVKQHNLTLGDLAAGKMDELMAGLLLADDY